MENYYGASILPESQIKDLEKVLCIGNHKNCHLHFTRGEFGDTVVVKKDIEVHRDSVLKQIEKNKKTL